MLTVMKDCKTSASKKGKGRDPGQNPQSNFPITRKHGGVSLPALTLQVSGICIYPDVESGKLARSWISSALQSVAPGASAEIEFFSYALLNHDSISWKHICKRIRPDIILFIGDGRHPLESGLRHSLHELLTHHNGKHPLVIFRNLEAEPSLNTRTLLDYISALSIRHHCELRTVNGNGGPIRCYRHPHFLLKTRRHTE